MVDNNVVVQQHASTSIATSRPRLVNSTVYTVDITDRFRKAASNLLPGTLIKDESFTLFESVGALEIGDPKMDSGCTDNAEELEDVFDVCKPLDANEMIWLMDELLSSEVAWHMGYPLSQTLFTSVYIEALLWPDPVYLWEAQFSRSPEIQHADPMLHKVFRSYCLGLIKSCDLVLGMVTGQHYYEEEDFATQLYNRELLHRFPVGDVLTEMESAIRYLDGNSLDNDLKQNLHARMTFRYDLLLMLSSHITTDMVPMSRTTFNHSLLQSIQSGKRLGHLVPNAFTLKIQRRLASTVPPRPMVTIDENRTFDYLRRFVRDCENAFSVLCASHSHDLLTGYNVFCAQHPQPSVYVRALMQYWLSREESVAGISNEMNFICDDMQLITLAGSPILSALVSHPDNLTGAMKLVRQHCYDFLGKNGRSFLNIWRTACLNRCRVRRTLCHAALEWDQIQAEAEELDDELQRLVGESAIVYPIGGVPTFAYAMSSWVYHYKLIQLRTIIQLGFELEIYAPHELPSMYWYLAHICDTHLAHLERISYFVSQRQAALEATPQPSAYERKEADDCKSNLRNLYRQFSLLKATEATARALHALYVVLQRHGQFEHPHTTYSSDHLRYELRMRPFLYLSIPEPITFNQCQRLCQMDVRNDMEMLEEATSHAFSAKKGWEEVLRAGWNTLPLNPAHATANGNIVNEMWTGDVKNAVKAAIGTSIAIMTLRKHVSKEGLNLSSSFGAKTPEKHDKDHWHSWWIVPRLTM